MTLLPVLQCGGWVELTSFGSCRGQRTVSNPGRHALLLFALLLPLSHAGWADDRLSVPRILTGEEAAKTMVVPEGFHVTLFAQEPDIRQPVGFCLDDRGRLWVAEAYGYPQHSDRPGRDRIVILEDTDHDGRFDERTIFYEGLNYLTGIEVGFGGAWVMSPPFFYFIPDQNRDDVPDGPPQLLLDGFGNHANSHNLANGFGWGPDGWLYATHGRTNWSLIGKPGAPESDRLRFDGGVWRYHPTRHEWEPYCDGTTNPWGIDWNDWGEAFISNCVNPHLFHVIPGAHYEPWRNRDSSRHAYERIETIADHLHFVTTGDYHEGIGTAAEDAAGGGHAHCGSMVYLGDNFPPAYRNSIFFNNIHGKRINRDILSHAGSGYTASHGPDLMRSHDPWMMGVTLQYGPDGTVYLLDWSDIGECHSLTNTQRETGRIYRIAYGTPTPQRIDVATLTDDQLVQLHLHPNDWFVRHARRVLQERHAYGLPMQAVTSRLEETLNSHPDTTRRLRALWTLHALSATTDDRLLSLLSDPDEHLVAWAITFLCEDRNPPPLAQRRFEQLAHGSSTPLIRRSLASALQRFPPDDRWTILTSLVARSEDATDQNLPLLYWYALEPLVDHDLPRFAELAITARIPLIQRHIARRITSLRDDWPGLDTITRVLSNIESPDGRREILTGMLKGLEGRRSVPRPPSWSALYEQSLHWPDESLRELATRLALVFNDPIAIEHLLTVAKNRDAPPDQRSRAITALVNRHTLHFEDELIHLTRDPSVRLAAIRGLGEYQHPLTPETLLGQYPHLSPDEQQTAIHTLTTRKLWAAALMEAVAQATVPRNDLSALTARQIRSFNDRELTQRLVELWGEVRESPAERQRLLRDWTRRLTPETIAAADPVAGRVLYRKLCSKCHKLFDDGGTIGPNITGSQRSNLDYLLENLLDPSASVSRDFQMEIIQTDAGRVLTGLVIAESDSALTLATATEQIVVPLGEIELRQTSPNSIMPEGLLNGLSPTDVRNLIRYLSSDRQVPLP